MKTYLKLKEIFNEASLTSDIAGILHWDMATMMPSSSRDQRSDQLAYLSKLSHSKISSSEVGDLIEDSKNLNLNNSDQKNLNEMDREYKLASAIPTELVEKISKSSAKCEGVWQEAREKSDFNLVKKDLEELINLTKEEANILGETFKISPYEALINKFEPSSEENKISEVFDDLQKFLTPLIDKIIDKQKKEETLQFETSIDEEKQKNISEYIMKQIGFDFTRGRLDKSVHPFCGGSTNDVRITTRYNNENPFSSLDGVMHETGHALYELNLPKDWMHQPVGKSRGMAMHESQSLFWENRIVKSKSFSKRFFKKFVSAGCTLNNYFELWKSINHLEAGLNRVEADELTYGLHILIRTELEIDLIEGGLPAEDIPTEWNKRYNELLGIKPSNDSEGCLQDVHWSEGAFGYFPSYLLGHLISAQISSQMERDIGLIDDLIQNGEYQKIIFWLRNNVHKYGRSVNSMELIRTVTKEELSPNYFINHLKSKINDFC